VRKKASLLPDIADLTPVGMLDAADLYDYVEYGLISLGLLRATMDNPLARRMLKKMRHSPKIVDGYIGAADSNAVKVREALFGNIERYDERQIEGVDELIQLYRLQGGGQGQLPQQGADDIEITLEALEIEINQINQLMTTNDVQFEQMLTRRYQALIARYDTLIRENYGLDIQSADDRDNVFILRQEGYLTGLGMAVLVGYDIPEVTRGQAENGEYYFDFNVPDGEMNQRLLWYAIQFQDHQSTHPDNYEWGEHDPCVTMSLSLIDAIRDPHDTFDWRTEVPDLSEHPHLDYLSEFFVHAYWQGRMIPVATTPAYDNIDLSSEEMAQIVIGSSVLYTPTRSEDPNDNSYLYYSHVTTVVGFGWTDEAGRTRLASSYEAAVGAGASAGNVIPYVMDRGLRETEYESLQHLQYPYPMNTDAYNSRFYAIWSPVPEGERDLRRTIAQSTPVLILPYHVRAATDEAYESDKDGEWIPENWPMPIIEYCDVPGACIGTDAGWVDNPSRYWDHVNDPDWYWAWYRGWVNIDE
jgi:hypothetical protein